MREGDFDEFAELLTAVFDIQGKTPAAKVISPAAQALFFAALGDYPLPAVRAALQHHIRVGKFTPVPADLISYIEATAGADNRPGAEEAWALALSTMDDTKTVIWTQEAAEAFGKAQPVLEQSGAISARKAFIEIYERIVGENRRAQKPPQWFASPGTDQQQRQLAMKAAIQAGRLAAPERLALPAPTLELAPCSLSPQEQLAKIQSMLLEKVAEQQRLADQAIDGRIQQEDEFKRNLARTVREREQYIKMADQAQVRRAEGEIEREAGAQ